MRFLEHKQSLSLSHALFPFMAIVAITWLSSAQALVLGMALALVVGNPYALTVKKLTPKLLGLAIVLLGFGIDFLRVLDLGLWGFWLSATQLGLGLFLGLMLGMLFKTAKNTSLLLSVGTSICGGSAIAAIAPVIRAEPQEIALSLGIVFLLNAAALLIFPTLGHFFNLSETQFGTWCALAIHDTSSVIAAAANYGPQALEVGTTLKLTRALWIVPLTIIIASLWQKKRQEKTHAQLRLPWFILGFILISALLSIAPALKAMSASALYISKKLLVLTLFAIGSSFTKDMLSIKELRSFLQGFFLWVAISALSLTAILSGLAS